MFRLHLAVRAYQELIQHIALLQVSEDENLRDAAKIIKGKSVEQNWFVNSMVDACDLPSENNVNSKLQFHHLTCMYTSIF